MELRITLEFLTISPQGWVPSTTLVHFPSRGSNSNHEYSFSVLFCTTVLLNGTHLPGTVAYQDLVPLSHELWGMHYLSYVGLCHFYRPVRQCLLTCRSYYDLARHFHKCKGCGHYQLVSRSVSHLLKAYLLGLTPNIATSWLTLRVTEAKFSVKYWTSIPWSERPNLTFWFVADFPSSTLSWDHNSLTLWPTLLAKVFASTKLIIPTSLFTSDCCWGALCTASCLPLL